MFTEKQIEGVLKQIQASIPQKLLDNIFIKKPVTPTIKQVAELALNENISEKKKQQIKDLLESGDLDRTTLEEDPITVKKIDAFVQRKIAQAVKEKRLPTKKQFKRLTYENKKTTN